MFDLLLWSVTAVDNGHKKRCGYGKKSEKVGKSEGIWFISHLFFTNKSITVAGTVNVFPLSTTILALMIYWQIIECDAFPFSILFWTPAWPIRIAIIILNYSSRSWPYPVRSIVNAWSPVYFISQCFVIIDMVTKVVIFIFRFYTEEFHVVLFADWICNIPVCL